MIRLTIFKLNFAAWMMLASIGTSAQVTFPAVTSLNAPDTPYELAKGDFNNDGKADLITANFENAVNQQLTLLLSNSTGTYTGTNFKNIGASQYLIDVAVGDFNKDGNLDAVGCSPQNNNFSLLLGNGAGNFSTAVNFAAGDHPYGIAVGDMNKDSNLDVLVSHNGTPDDVYIFFGNGAGGFSAPATIAISDFASDIAVADFNGDTNPDFAVSASTGSVAKVQVWFGNGLTSPTFTLGPVVSGFGNIEPDVDARDVDGDGDMDILASPGFSLNNGSGTFAAPVALSQSDVEFAVGDLNDDGHPDIAAVDFSTSIHPNINIFSGNGAGVFTQVARFEVTCSVRGLEILDMNNDGNPDLVAVGGLAGEGKIEVLLGDGTGYFSNSVIKYPTTTDPRDLVKGDFNEDGIMDVALCHSTGANNLSVYLGLGQGRFSKSTTNYSAGIFPFQILAFDYNKDNHIDLVTFNQSGSSSITVFTGLGNGQFTALPDIPVVTTTGRMATADFNNDTYPDLVVTGYTARVVYLFTGNGTGFNAPSSFPVTQDVFDVLAADFNNDDNQDLAVYYNNTHFVALITGDGNGGFTEGAQYNVTCDYLRIDDLNGDGHPDINAFDIDNGGSDFLINDGTGVFAGSSISVPLGGSPMGFADMNGDGFKDLILGTQFGNSSQPGTINIYRGTATGPSSSSLISKTFSGGNRLITHDVNGDGKEDIIATSFNVYGDYLSILINTSGPVACTPPTISFLTPSPTVCSGEGVILSVTAGGTSPFTYRWKKGGVDISEGTESSIDLGTVTVTDGGNYTCLVTNGCGNITSSAIVLTVNLSPTAPAVTSAGSCDPASVTLGASGSTDGNYRWYAFASGGTAIPGELNSAYETPLLNATTHYYVSITNGTCESARSEATATIGGTACGNQPPLIATANVSAVPEGNVTIDLLTLISDPDDNLDVNSLKIIQPPASGAEALISNGILTIDYQGILFTGTDELTVEACDLIGSCTQQKLTVEVHGDLIVYNGFSPNGDLFNPTWQIENIDLLATTRTNKVTIYNRWGDEVFHVDNYDNHSRVFKGTSNGGGDLPSGTYFYRIEFVNGPATMTGYLVLKK